MPSTSGCAARGADTASDDELGWEQVGFFWFLSINKDLSMDGIKQMHSHFGADILRGGSLTSLTSGCVAVCPEHSARLSWNRASPLTFCGWMNFDLVSVYMHLPTYTTTPPHMKLYVMEFRMQLLICWETKRTVWMICRLVAVKCTYLIDYVVVALSVCLFSLLFAPLPLLHIIHS